MKRKIHIFVPVTLGMLTAFGPFVTDFYLPVLPEMSEYFNATPSAVSMSLTCGMVGLAAGQVMIGPLTDKYGRKGLLIISMLLFALASIMCVLSPNILVFNAMRVFQGLAGAGGIVISKSMATDMYEGADLTRFMAVLAAINGIAPVFAPVIGGSVAGLASWRGVFGLLLGVGLVLMVCSSFLRETLPNDRRMHAGLASVYGNLFRVFRNPVFSLSTFAIAACFFTFFGYISSSPFILQRSYGLSPFGFSLCYGVNAMMIVAGSALGAMVSNQRRGLSLGAAVMLTASVVVAVCLLLHAPLPVLMCSYAALMVGFGMIQPAATAIALDSERENAGAASAIFGAAGFVGGAVSSPLVPLGDIAVTSGLIMVGGAVLGAIIIAVLGRRMKAEGIG